MPPKTTSRAKDLPSSGEYKPTAAGETWQNSTHTAVATLTDRLGNLQWSIVSNGNSSVSRIRLLHIDGNPNDIYQQVAPGAPDAYPGEPLVDPSDPTATPSSGGDTASLLPKGK